MTFAKPWKKVGCWRRRDFRVCPPTWDDATTEVSEVPHTGCTKLNMLREDSRMIRSVSCYYNNAT